MTGVVAAARKAMLSLTVRGPSGREQDVLVLEARGSLLLGMAMLRGCRLTVDVLDGGRVTVVPLP